MLDFLTAIDAISLLALLVLSLLIHENSHLEAAEKRSFYKTYVIIGLATLAELAGLMLNGQPESTHTLHLLVKCANYILTPAAGVFFVSQVSRQGRLRQSMWALLIANAALQISSVFNGWTFYVDADNIYHHGPLYPLYIGVYCAAIAVVLWEFIRYSRQFKKQNHGSLLAICATMVLGILAQEALGLRVCYLTMSVCSMLLFIHYSEFSQLRADDHLQYHKHLLSSDPLTGLYSRYAYSEDLQQYEKALLLPNDLVVFSIDLNDLKTTNDSLGHLAGDELLQGAGECILKVLGSYGKCYRTGGDEFIAILRMPKERISNLKTALQNELCNWHGQLVKGINASIGTSIYADSLEIHIEKLVALADAAMYQEKDRYYQQTGKRRR